MQFSSSSHRVALNVNRYSEVAPPSIDRCCDGSPWPLMSWSWQGSAGLSQLLATQRKYTSGSLGLLLFRQPGLDTGGLRNGLS